MRCPPVLEKKTQDLILIIQEKMHYLFGGNPGRTTLPQLRLDDFWILVLEKPTREEILNHCRYLVRKLYYEEITRVDPIRALRYLQTHVSEVINHSDPVQLNNFHKLAAFLFRPEEPAPVVQMSLSTLPLENQLNKISKDNSPTNVEDKIDEIEEDSSIESCNSNSTLSDSTSYFLYRKSGGRLARQDYLFELRSHRAFLFNKISQLMPTNIVQPKGNLSDFVLT